MVDRVLGRPNRFADSAVVKVDIVHAIVRWTEALGSDSALSDALAGLVSGLGADAGALVRTNLTDLRPVCLAICDPSRSDPLRRPLRAAFADRVFGPTHLSARPATLWIASAHADDLSGDPALPDWQAARHLHEFVVFVLASGRNTRDHIELHFRDRLGPDAEAALAAILPDMSRIWTSRKAGLITRSIVNHHSTAMIPQPAAFPAPLLSSENPMRLSRAEFRVCLLLSRGLLVPAVSKELDLSETTIRSHLRNIYAKTGSTCLAELVFRLMDRRPQPELVEMRRA